MILDKIFRKKVYIPLGIVEAADRGDEKSKETLNRAFEKGLSSEEHNIGWAF